MLKQKKERKKEKTTNHKKKLRLTDNILIQASLGLKCSFAEGEELQLSAGTGEAAAALGCCSRTGDGSDNPSIVCWRSATAGEASSDKKKGSSLPVPHPISPQTMFSLREN